jgi:kynureninase
MVLIEPTDPSSPTLSTEQITSMIDEHADSTALVLLPGIQYYSGQYFDIPKITAHAHSKGVLIGWDCAHAVGNVELKLHEWDVDFAAWCNYKYMNSGPGAIGGLFVHEKHGKIEQGEYRPRLSGWWGGQQATRFEMKPGLSCIPFQNTWADSRPEFAPRPGAKGYQISNPSALDLAAVVASLEIFGMTSMSELRKKSLHITGYLEHILLKYPLDAPPGDKPFTIITSSNPEERGAQLSIRLEPGLLDSVLEDLEDNGVVIDERKPDVIRVAPTPLYNTYEEVWEFVQIFLGACRKAVQKKSASGRA